MKPQDKTILDDASNGSLTKYKTATEAWQVITDLAESTQNARHRNNHPKAIVEAVVLTKVGTTIKVGKTTPTRDREITPTKAGETIPTKDGGTTTIKKAETTVKIRGGTTTIISRIGISRTLLTNSRTKASLIEHLTKRKPSTLSSQLLPNPKGKINVITLRSGTTLQERSHEEPSSREDIRVEDIVEVEDAEEEEEKVQDMVGEEVAQPRNGVPKEDEVTREAIPIPFPHIARKPRKQMELDPKMVEIFKKVEVTISLFDAIRQEPKYAKFLKYLCVNKDKIHDLETIPLGSSISTLMGAIPKKYGDPGPCMVTCTIEGVQFFDCMCDLGACVSIMPLSIYDALRLPPLKRSAARFVLADKSIISVVGIAEDVLVSIKGLTFPIDFYILEMPPNDSGRPSSILLGRPFLKTSRFKLDAFSETYSFEIDGRAVSFNLDEAMKHPPEDHSIPVRHY
ncbi:uncharacterized protein LOC130957222 [Arachis stenosperma]|uniref:uncharacterized protein LOC130957222 n=1 Tax=Arachis stenosperma TaxID=217475 RepID=UPI0025ACAE84|nr:uncharacterized protein LOC130957222 [Arachis stenosperma]